MMCDMIFAADTATLPNEIKLGLFGDGGDPTFDRVDWQGQDDGPGIDGAANDRPGSREQAGLVSRVYPAANLLDEVLAVAAQIASFSRTATRAARQAVEQSLEVGLHEGVRQERRLFHGLFATPDQQEGMQAFLRKRQPLFNQR